jgi:hypothetical protein
MDLKCHGNELTGLIWLRTMTSTELLCVMKQWISWHAGNLTEELLRPSSSTLLHGVSGQSQTPLLEKSTTAELVREFCTHYVSQWFMSVHTDSCYTAVRGLRGGSIGQLPETQICKGR